MRLSLLIAIVMIVGCQVEKPPEDPSINQAIAKMSRSQATGDMIPAPHSNSWGVSGLATQLESSTDAVFFNCRIAVFGHILGTKNLFSSRYSILNVTTGWTDVYYKVGLSPFVECFGVNGCDFSLCPSDSSLQVNGLFCFPDSSSDEYDNRIVTGAALLDTTKVYQYAVMINLNTPQTVATWDPRKSVGVFGFTYKWNRDQFGDALFVATYDSSFITPSIVSRLKNIK